MIMNSLYNVSWKHSLQFSSFASRELSQINIRYALDIRPRQWSWFQPVEFSADFPVCRICWHRRSSLYRQSRSMCAWARYFGIRKCLSPSRWPWVPYGLWFLQNRERWLPLRHLESRGDYCGEDIVEEGVLPEEGSDVSVGLKFCLVSLRLTGFNNQLYWVHIKHRFPSLIN